jgi:hypothetical protein
LVKAPGGSLLAVRKEEYMTTKQYRDGYERAIEDKAREQKDSGCAESMVKFPGRALGQAAREFFASGDANKGYRDGRRGEPFNPPDKDK